MFATSGYILPVTKRLVDIDDGLLARARAKLDQTTMKGTIDAALRLVVRDDLVREHLAWLHDPTSFELTPEEMKALREPDLPFADD